jgi:hypothetical protein
MQAVSPMNRFRSTLSRFALLYVLASAFTVGLLSSTTQAQSIRHGDIVVIECQGEADGARYLDGRTEEAMVGLASKTTGHYSGTRWQVRYEGGYYYFYCLGKLNPDGPRFLDGRTGRGTVGLAPRTDDIYTGTRWTLSERDDGTFNIRCEGSERGVRWLDGRTLDGTVGLAPRTDGIYTGTRWRILRVR